MLPPLPFSESESVIELVHLASSGDMDVDMPICSIPRRMLPQTFSFPIHQAAQVAGRHS